MLFQEDLGIFSRTTQAWKSKLKTFHIQIASISSSEIFTVPTTLLTTSKNGQKIEKILVEIKKIQQTC